MAVVSLPEVQQWLESTKLTITSVDTQFETTARTSVFAELSQVFPDNYTTWLDPASTPALIRQAISMFIAGWTYNRQYSEDIGADKESGYGYWLIRTAQQLVTNIVNGTLDVVEIAGIAITADPASFYPDDSTGASQQYDDSGTAVGSTYSSAAKFRMGDRF